MKYHKKWWVVMLALIVVLWAGTALCQKLMSVQVKKGQLRATPSFLGKIMGNLSYGDQVEVLSEKGPWARVKKVNAKTGGWLHASALTTKKIILKPGAADVKKAASSDELALAGKGFNKQVENQFRAQNPNMDFTWVDRMEKMTVSDRQIQAFLKAGGLKAE